MTSITHYQNCLWSSYRLGYDSIHWAKVHFNYFFFFYINSSKLIKARNEQKKNCWKTFQLKEFVLRLLRSSRDAIVTRKRLDSNWDSIMPLRLPLVEFLRSQRLSASPLPAHSLHKKMDFSFSKRPKRASVCVLFLWFNGTRMCVRPEQHLPTVYLPSCMRLYGFAAFNCERNTSSRKIAGALREF